MIILYHKLQKEQKKKFNISSFYPIIRYNTKNRVELLFSNNKHKIKIK